MKRPFPDLYRYRIKGTTLICAASLCIFALADASYAEEAKVEPGNVPGSAAVTAKDVKPQDRAAKDTYVLSFGDEIDIKVSGEDDLSNMYRVNNNGEIRFPILGKIKVEGMTISQMEEHISKLLERDYFKIKVTVDAQIKKFHKRRVTISGEVKSPGPFDFGDDKNMTLAELLTLAGGPTEKACLNRTTIIRSEPDGKTRKLEVNAGDVMAAKAKDIILSPGDRVNVPSANVIVIGEVTKPGTYGFGDVSKLTLLGAISTAGGFTRIASLNPVTIIRVDEFGNRKQIKVNVKNIYYGKERDVPLEPDDIIVVQESWF
ncbi:MAG: polysaccharide biosynthesis/export family protein [Candidatus Omnitrophota bacterium]